MLRGFFGGLFGGRAKGKGASTARGNARTVASKPQRPAKRRGGGRRQNVRTVRTKRQIDLSKASRGDTIAELLWGGAPVVRLFDGAGSGS